MGFRTKSPKNYLALHTSMGCAASTTSASSSSAAPLATSATPFYDAFIKAFEAKDVEASGSLYDDECIWTWHSSGKTSTKAELMAMMPNFMKMPPSQKQRCLYENSEICVSHAFNRFPNGDVEGTMMVMKLRNGKCYAVETGSTIIPKDSPNYIHDDGCSQPA